MDIFFSQKVTVQNRRTTIYNGPIVSPISFYAIPEDCCLAFSLSEAKVVTFLVTGTNNSLPVTEDIVFTSGLENRGFQVFDELTSITVAGDLGGNVTIYPLRQSGEPVANFSTSTEVLADRSINQETVSIEIPGESRTISKNAKFYFPKDTVINPGDVIIDDEIRYFVKSVVAVHGFPNFISHLEVTYNREPY